VGKRYGKGAVPICTIFFDIGGVGTALGYKILNQPIDTSVLIEGLNIPKNSSSHRSALKKRKTLLLGIITISH